MAEIVVSGCGHVICRCVTASWSVRYRGPVPALDEVVAARRLDGPSVDEIARRMDCDPELVHKIENGGDVHLSTLQRYVGAAGYRMRMELGRLTDG